MVTTCTYIAHNEIFNIYAVVILMERHISLLFHLSLTVILFFILSATSSYYLCFQSSQHYIQIDLLIHIALNFK